jgi:hypothetical protein
MHPELRYCWMATGYDICTGEDLCVVAVGTDMGTVANMSCTEFYYHLNWPFREKPRGSSLKGRKVNLVALE